MRAILLLLMVTAGCGNKGGNTFELDIAVNAPQASSAVVDGVNMLPATGGAFARGFSSVSAAASAHGTVATLDADRTTRATATYELGSYCTSQMPLLRQTMHFVETVDTSNVATLALDTVECEKSDGTGTIVHP